MWAYLHKQIKLRNFVENRRRGARDGGVFHEGAEGWQGFCGMGKSSPVHRLPGRASQTQLYLGKMESGQVMLSKGAELLFLHAAADSFFWSSHPRRPLSEIWGE